MALPDFLRKQIIEQVVEDKPLLVAPSRQAVVTPVLGNKYADSKMREHRNALKSIHQYERICKLDSEEWDEDTWDGYEQWLQKNEKKAKDMSMEETIESVFRSKNECAKDQEEDKSRLRKQILEAGFGKNFDKIMSKF